MYIQRNFDSKFEDFRSEYQVIAIVGPRQSGKTTFLREKMKDVDASYVLFDDPDARDLFEDDIKKFEKQYVEDFEVSILDEIQYCDNAGQKLKYLADNDNKLWITSSSEILLKKEVLSYLVGRVSINRLHGFDFEEFCRAKNQKEMNEKIRKRMTWEHMVFGGYPDIVTTKENEIKKDKLRNLQRTMLLKDVADTFSIQDVDKLEKLVNYLAEISGEMLKYQKVSSELDIGFKTVKKYITAMEQSYVLQRVKPFKTNKRKEIVKRPKIYFVDTGLRNRIRGEFPQAITGELFENYVFNELVRQDYEPKYWRTKTGLEVDFILEDEIPVEVKKKQQIGKVPSGLKSFIQDYKPPKAYIIRYEGEKGRTEFNECKVNYISVQDLKKGDITVL